MSRARLTKDQKIVWKVRVPEPALSAPLHELLNQWRGVDEARRYRFHCHCRSFESLQEGGVTWSVIHGSRPRSVSPTSLEREEVWRESWLADSRTSDTKMDESQLALPRRHGLFPRILGLILPTYLSASSRSDKDNKSTFSSNLQQFVSGLQTSQ
jgi:hypothetical protein